ncbi:MAG: DNA primase [Alphaproteobacteria bacterium]|nr:MAG: DNA primase [Alphaproteobacteria bacterium]
MSLDELKVKIKEEIPISSVIGSYISMKKSGSAYLSLCPFHSDSKPSMHINDNKKMFKCFACDAAGDSIGFVMKYRNLDFVEALKEICQKQGINFDSYQEEKKSNPKLDMAKKILTKTAQLYRKTATTHKFSPYDDFIKKRGLNEEIATTYNLGFAQAKNSLCDYLGSIPNESERSFALSIALELGLIKRDQHNSEAHYDTFRDRIIFPIWDQFGQVTGFTSRAIRDDQKAKYMNSVDSFVFNKRNILYGFHLAKNAIREKDAVILVEGNMDQIALYNNGFHHTVAVMGIALGAPSLERLLSLTKNIYLALDSDGAGFTAMERINRQLAEKGVVAKYLEFSPQKDPDEFLQAQGALALQAKIDNAAAAFDVLLNKIVPEKLPEVLDRKLEILNNAFELLSPLRSHLTAVERIVAFAKRLGLKSEPAQIVKNYEEFLAVIEAKEKNTARFQSKTKPVEVEQDENNYGMSSLEISELDLQSKVHIAPKRILSKIERQVVQELVQLPMLFSEGNSLELLDFVTSDEVKNYIRKVKKVLLEIDESEYSSVISNLTSGPEYSSELREAVSSALFKYKVREMDSKTKKKLIHDLTIKLQMDLLKNKKDEIKQLQQNCVSETEMTKLLQELSEVEVNMQALKKNSKKQTNV